MALEIDSATGDLLSANARGDQGWVDVTRQLDTWTSAIPLADG